MRHVQQNWHGAGEAIPSEPPSLARAAGAELALDRMRHFAGTGCRDAAAAMLEAGVSKEQTLAYLNGTLRAAIAALIFGWGVLDKLDLAESA